MAKKTDSKTKKVDGRGGARPGAGRPRKDPAGPRVSISFRLPPDVAEFLREERDIRDKEVETLIGRVRKAAEKKATKEAKKKNT